MPGKLMRTGIALILLLVLVTGSGWLMLNDTGRPNSPTQPANDTEFVPTDLSIAVLPFDSQNADTGSTQIFAHGTRAGILDRLSRIPELNVTASTSVLALKESRYPAPASGGRRLHSTASNGRADTTGNAPAIGKQLGAANLVTGTVDQSKDRIRINLQMIDAASSRPFWTGSYDRILSVKNFHAMLDEITAAITQPFSASPDRDMILKSRPAPTDDLDAFEAVLASRLKRQTGGFNALASAADYARKALSLDPGYPDAGVALASALTSGIDAGYSRAEEMSGEIPDLLESALSMDPSNADAWMTRGHYQVINGNPESVISYRRALEIRPGDAETLRGYSMALQAADQPEKALPFALQALKLDPLSLPTLLATGYAHDTLDQHERAREAFARVRELYPEKLEGYSRTGLSYLAQGRLDEALYWMNRALELDPDRPETAGWMLFLNDCLEDYAAADQWSAWLSGQVTNQPQPLAMQARHYYLTGDFELALQYSNLALRLGLPGLKTSDAVFMRIKRDEALARGDPESGIRVFTERHPELFGEIPVIRSKNVSQANDLALLLTLAGRQASAERILQAVLAATEKPFFTGGSNGAHAKSARAEALAMLGDAAGSLAELRRIVSLGWRASWRWNTDLNPNFNRIRNQDEFKLLLRELEADTALQRARVRDMAESGEITPPLDEE